MKKIVGAVAILSCVVALSVGSALAAGKDDGTVSRYCRDRNDLGISHGACVAFFKSGNTTPHDADVCKLLWVRSFVGADNEGECVTALAAMKR
jgi:hypothetical protein